MTRAVTQDDKEQLKKLKIVFDMEYSTSTLLAKDNFNVAVSMTKAIDRTVEIQERWRSYRKKKNQRIVELRKEGMKPLVNVVKFKDNAQKTIKEAVQETLRNNKQTLIENGCEVEIQRWKIKNNPRDWTEETQIKDKLRPE